MLLLERGIATKMQWIHVEGKKLKVVSQFWLEQVQDVKQFL